MCLSDTIRDRNCFDDFLDDFMDFRDSSLHLLDDDFLDNLFYDNRFFDCISFFYNLYFGNFDILNDFLFDSECITHLIRVGLVDECLEEVTEPLFFEALLEDLVLHIVIFKLRKCLPKKGFEFKLMVFVLKRFESCRNTTESSLIESHIIIMQLTKLLYCLFCEFADVVIDLDPQNRLILEGSIQVVEEFLQILKGLRVEVSLVLIEISTLSQRSCKFT